MARIFPLFSQMASAMILCSLRFLEDKKQKRGICPVRDSANSRVGMAHVLNGYSCLSLEQIHCTH